MRFATANIQALPLMPPRHVLSDVREVASLAGIIGWQEIDPRRYKDAVGAAGEVLGLEHSTPVSHHPRFVVVDHGQELLHEPKAGYNGPRKLTWQYLHDVTAHVQFVHINAHYVPRAWHQEDGSARLRRNRSDAAQQPLRQDMWEAGNARHRALIKRFLDMGLPVVTTADWNRAGRPDLLLGNRLHGRRVQYAKHGLDAIAFVDAGRRRSRRWRLLGGPLIVDLHSDHPAIVQRARLGREAGL